MSSGFFFIPTLSLCPLEANHEDRPGQGQFVGRPAAGASIVPKSRPFGG
jgi:hypothetical protein